MEDGAGGDEMRPTASTACWAAALSDAVWWKPSNDDGAKDELCSDGLQQGLARESHEERRSVGSDGFSGRVSGWSIVSCECA